MNPTPNEPPRPLSPGAFGWDDPIPRPARKVKPPAAGREPARLSDTDRATLCARASLLDLLAADGVDVRREGNHYAARLRPDDKTPSCKVWPPGTGKRGADGWTWHDYGSGKGGDALAYLVDVRGLAFMDAARLLGEKGGWMPEALQGPAPAGSPPRKPAPRPEPPPQVEPVAVMNPDAQAAAVQIFLAELLAMNPAAAEGGRAYLRGRGCLPDGWPDLAFLLRGDDCPRLAALLAAGPDAPAMVQAGILKPAEAGRPPRLVWWDRVCLLVCMDRRGRAAYLVGRRMDWKPGTAGGKYLNQSTAAGAVRLPFGLPCAYAQDPALAGLLPAFPRSTAGDLLLVEGPLDALGAVALGWPAVAMLNRPQAAADYLNRDTAAARMLDPHLPALRDCRRVVVMPDRDEGPKGDEGKRLALRLVAWLRAAGCRAEAQTLPDLFPDAPAECKDLAELAELKGTARNV